jgi:hypothetical protein
MRIAEAPLRYLFVRRAPSRFTRTIVRELLPDGNREFSTVLKVASAFGLRLCATATDG